MRRLIALTLTVACVLTAPAFADPANQVRVRDWRPMSVAIRGNSLVYGISTVNAMRGGYTVYQTDTFRIPIRGTVPSAIGRRVQGVLMRTSAGAGTAGPLVTDAQGRHLIVATGANFTPQVIACCTDAGLPTPVEVSGAPGAPVTLAATLEWPNARMLTVGDGDLTLVSYGLHMASPYPTTGRLGRRLGSPPRRRLAAIAPGAVAWVDATSGDVRVMSIPTPLDGAPADVVTIHPQDEVRRLAVSATTVALVRGTGDTGYQLVRYDAPAWTPTVVWRGARLPDAMVLDGQALVLGIGTRIVHHTPAGGLITAVRVATKAAALATDGTRVVVVERIRLRGRKFTSMRVWPLATPATTARGAAR